VTTPTGAGPDGRPLLERLAAGPVGTRLPATVLAGAVCDPGNRRLRA